MEQSDLFEQLIGDFETITLEKPVEESKTANPEVDVLRDYLIGNLLKLAKYDKGTVLQLLDE